MILTVKNQYSKYFPYTLLKNKRVYYDCTARRLPHNGVRERQRRIRQAMVQAQKRNNLSKVYEQIGLYGRVV